jgi:glycosyltransferase involved in cell wall biosynthesis
VSGLGSSTSLPRGTRRRRIAVVPAYNEEPTVEAVLDRLYPLVDELVVVDDGSTDHTRKIIEEWLARAPQATLLTFDQNRGMSAAYYEAFTHLAARVRAGEISPDDHVFTVDADGQHELAVFDELCAVMESDGLDALLVRRDLSTYPRYKRSGNWLISAWASLWAGYRLYDVESGYRVFRASALVDALGYYRGYKYSETVEIAVVLGRRGANVRNDVLVAVPVFRSRTRLVDFAIDAGMIPVAAARVWLGRAGRGGRLAPVPAPSGQQSGR